MPITWIKMPRELRDEPWRKNLIGGIIPLKGELVIWTWERTEGKG